MQKNKIPALKKGDLIYITAPAKSIEKKIVDHAKAVLEKNGYSVLISSHCTGEFNYFSGTDEERTSDFQFGLDHPEVKAILCARGGYGCIRILDRLQWAGMIREPKWLIGFSDVTVFHQRMQRFGLPSIHGTMPLNFEDNSGESFETLFAAIQNQPYSISAPFSPFNKTGKVEGKLVGGNLSILFSLLGTDDQINYEDSILFIEDLAEQLYHLDRMFFAFQKAGILDKIKGLIVGGMTDLKDTAVPFGKSYQEIILEHFQFRSVPIAFDFPSGHIPDNRALVLGGKVVLEVTSENTFLDFS